MVAVNSELKMAATVESETETDSGTSGHQPFISKKRQHKIINIVVKNTLKQEMYHFYFI